MKNLILTLLLFCALTASAAQRITLTITVTNAADTGDELVVSSASRIFTNANSVGTILTNLVGKNETATNLYNQIASFPYTGPLTLQYAGTNSIKLIGTLGGALAASSAGNWAVLTLSTQSAPSTYTALWPIENIPEPSNRIGQASALVKGMSDSSTNAIGTNSTMGSNFVHKGAGPAQYVSTELRISGNINNGTGNLSISNGVNSGRAFRSEGIGGNSLQLGSNATATGSRTVAVGNSALASGTDSLSVGTGAQGTNGNATAVGVSSVANQNGAAIGTTANATGLSSTSLGAASQATGAGSTAAGNLTQATGAGAFAGGQGALASGDYSISLGNEDTEATGTNAVAIGINSVASGYRSAAVGPGTTAGYDFSSAFGGYDHTGNFTSSTGTNQVRLGTANHVVSIPGTLEVLGTITNPATTGTNRISGQFVFVPVSNTGLANGYNAGVAINSAYVKFSGPSAAYTNAGFSAANKMDGKMHFCQFDNPGLSMTLLHDSGLDAGNSTNRIYTGTGALLNSTNRVVHVIMSYDDSATAWRIWSFR